MGSTTDISPGLREAVERLSRTGWAAEVLDSEWRLVWVSDALCTVLGDPGGEALGVGSHVLEARERDAWRAVFVRDNYLDVIGQLAPTMLHDSELPDGLPEDVRAVLDEAEPGEPFSVWNAEFTLDQEKMPPTWVSVVAVRLRDDDGAALG